MKATLAICLLILFVSACAPKEQYAPFKIVPAETPSTNVETEPSPDTLPSQGSGVKGQVLIGPTCPVMRVEDPCPDQPYQAKITVYSLNGQEVTRFETDKDGKFAVNLPPGDYILHPKSPDGRPIPSAEDVEFTVLPNEFTEVIVNFDSGIR